MKTNALPLINALFFACALQFAGSSAFAQVSSSCSPNSPAGSTCGGEGPATQGNQSEQEQGGGNPINLISGNKYQREVDMPALNGELGLEVVRHYNSQSIDFTGHIGRGWRLSYETEIRRSDHRLQLIQADGTVLHFVCSKTSACRTARWADGRIDQTPQGYTWHWVAGPHAGRQLVFNERGQLVSIKTLTAYALTINRDSSEANAGRIRSIVDPQGRELVFNYPSSNDLALQPAMFNGVQSIDTPVGRINYQYGSVIPSELPPDQLAANVTLKGRLFSKAFVDRQSNLTSASLFSGAKLVYHFESVAKAQASLLTGISLSQAGMPTTRLSSYLYDATGKAVLSTKGEPARLAENGRLAPNTGIEQISITRSIQGQTLLMNSLGQHTLYKHATIAGQPRILEAIGSGCAQCGPVNVRYKFDKSGALVEKIQLTPTLVEVNGKGQSSFNKAPAEIEAIKLRRDSIGRITEVWSVSYNTESNSRKAKLKDKLIQKIEYAADQSGEPSDRPQRVSRPSIAPSQWHTFSYQYNAFGQVTQVKETGFSYAINSAFGHSIDAAQLGFEAIERTTSYNYALHLNRSVLTEIDGPLPNGPKKTPKDSDITQFGYDEKGRATKTVFPMDLTQLATYDTVGRPSSQREASGRFTQYFYAPTQPFITSATVANGIAVGYTFDAQGKIIASGDINGRGVAVSFDSFGRPISIRDAQGYRQELSLDSENHRLAVYAFEPNSEKLLRAQYQKFDPFGRLTHQLKADGRLDSFEYDDTAHGRGSLARHVDGNDVMHLHKPSLSMSMTTDGFIRAALPSKNSLRDDFGRTVANSLHDHGIKLFSFDEANNLKETKVIGKDGKLYSTHQYQRDAAGRLVQKISRTESGELQQTITLRYSGALLSSIDDHTQSVDYSHDNYGRVVSTKTAIKGKSNGIVFTAALQTTYDPTTGDISAQRLADGQQMIIKHDLLTGYPQEISVRTQVPLWKFWDSGERKVASNLHFHPFNGVESFTFGNGIKHKKTFDTAGRVVALDTTALNRQQLFYGVGPKIVGSQNFGASPEKAVYQYAGFGELKSPDLKTAQANPIATDAVGRTISDDRYRYSYNVHGQVEKVYGLNTDRLIASYEYNAEKQRVSKTVGGRTTYFLWHNNKLVAEIDGSGKLQYQYLYLTESSRSDPVSTAAPIARLNAADLSISFIHTDHRSAPIAMTNSKQQVTWRSNLSPFGIATLASTNKQELNIRLPGQYFDAETGLHDNWHRTYNPTTGRYLQPDPLGYPDGPDPYLYASGDPINKVDVKGLYDVEVHYYMTYFLARLAGISAQESYTIALATQFIDDNPNTWPLDPDNPPGNVLPSNAAAMDRLSKYHFTQRGYDRQQYANEIPVVYDQSRVANPSNPQLNRLLSASYGGTTTCAKAQLFGEYLHAFEDTFSHRDPLNDPIGVNLGIGHFLYGHHPDYTFNHRDEINRSWNFNEQRTFQMEVDTFARLLDYAVTTKLSSTKSLITIIHKNGQRFSYNKVFGDGHWGSAAVMSTFNSMTSTTSQMLFLDETLSDLGLGPLPAYDAQIACNKRKKNLAGLSPSDYPGTILGTSGC